MGKNMEDDKEVRIEHHDFRFLLLWNGTKMETRGGNDVVLMKRAP